MSMMPSISGKGLSMLMRSKQSGFTLIEVLVTVLILAIGFLGLAGLQLSALRNNNSAYERSQASILTYDIIDRMRANRDSALNGDYDTNLTDAPTATDCRGSGSNCNTTQLAQYDVNQWKCSLGDWNSHASCQALGMTGKLPKGDGSIELNSTEITVTVQWEDNRSEAAAADKLTSFSITTTM
ncbi:type IV pilus modification protein PilV [Thiohalophilus sp.]|uniref:type IV pilus modification protein PilV n=1 Tax=Thiohalophilus sp. TaxID=3028392 RepID=UPI002ACE523F|nr:type IV pilus modification protein PilV [Thiohalophilus sp.]MDZ7663690.1 type IV pilus modification protein PilV [Thiohalophilus sp.]